MKTAPFQINLISRERACAHKRTRWANVAIVILGVGIGLEVACLRSLERQESQVSARLMRAQAQTQNATAQWAQLGRPLTPQTWESLQQESEAVNALIEKRQVSWLFFFHDLEQHLPQEVFLSQIQPEGTTIRMSGEAATLAALTAFLNRLQKDSDFHDVFLMDQKQVSENSEQAASGIAFSMRLRYGSLPELRQGDT